jgi:septal ring factor EnvC (AmiA/AmiB activator)
MPSMKLVGGIAATALLGLGVGAAANDNQDQVDKLKSTTKELRAQVTRERSHASDLETQLADAQEAVDAAQERARTADARASRKAKHRLASRSAALDARSHALDRRASAIKVAEAEYERGTIPGDARLRVGSDVDAGVYQAKSPSSGNCYWARLGSDNGSLDDIIENGNEAGPVTITIAPTDHLIELSGCEEFHKVG